MTPLPLPASLVARGIRLCSKALPHSLFCNWRRGHRRAHAPAIPGPVIGLGLLAGYALWRGGIPAQIEQAGEALLKHLSLLFVPAGVGLIAFGDRLLAEGARLIVVLVVSTALTMIVTALVFRALAKPEDE